MPSDSFEFHSSTWQAGKENQGHPSRKPTTSQCKSCHQLLFLLFLHLVLFPRTHPLPPQLAPPRSSKAVRPHPSARAKSYSVRTSSPLDKLSISQAPQVRSLYFLRLYRYHFPSFVLAYSIVQALIKFDGRERETL
jgi:hypothetical protein